MGHKLKSVGSVATLAGALTLVVFPAFSESFTSTIAEVFDGDTLTVDHGGKAETVRVAAVDCPEMAQHFGPEARKFTADLALGKEAVFETRGADSEGRTIAVVTLPDGKGLGREILGAGWGWYYEKHGVSDAALRALVARAIVEKKGLWVDAAPLAPWDFRGDARKEKAAGGAAPAVAAANPEEASKKEMKMVSAKGDLASIEREEFSKPQASSKAADVAKLLDDPIAKQLGVTIARDSSGKVTGVSAQNLSAFPLAGAWGFQDGDVVQSVNGDRIDSLERLSELYEKYKNTRTFQVGVVRNGQPIAISVNVPDFLK